MHGNGLNVMVSEVLYSDINMVLLQNSHCVSQVLSVKYQLVNGHRVKHHCCYEPKERLCRKLHCCGPKQIQFRELRYSADRICPLLPHELYLHGIL